MRIRLQVRDKYNQVVSTFEPEAMSLDALPGSFIMSMMQIALAAGHLVMLEDLDAKT